MSIRSLAILIAIVLVEFNAAHAQTTFQFGGLPALNVNKKLQKNWSLNTKIESRQLFQRGVLSGDIDRTYEYVLTDFSFIAAKRLA